MLLSEYLSCKIATIIMSNRYTSSKVKSISKSETRPLTLSCLYFFSLLCSYYLLRPLRDEMGIRAGVENLSWLFSGTFFTMLLVIPLVVQFVNYLSLINLINFSCTFCIKLHKKIKYIVLYKIYVF